MSKYRWREIERELIRFFESEGCDVLDDGDKHIEFIINRITGETNSISLTSLAHVLAESSDS